MKPVRKIQPKCKACRFFSGKVDEPRLSQDDRAGELGVCRRYAPRPQQGRETDEEWCSFPIVMHDDWCGEWQHKGGK